jgi:hypothetical protein
MPASTARQSNLDFGRLFEPDPLAAAQHASTAKRTYPLQPELRLLAAVLEDAVAALTTDQRRCSSRQRRDYRETLRWINAGENNDWVFSFSNVCEALGLDPNYLRAGLLRKIGAVSGPQTAAVKAKGRHHSSRRKVVRLRLG